MLGIRSHNQLLTRRCTSICFIFYLFIQFAENFSAFFL
uniref:Uncharacterized protein n=1 Tax=Arundo donax TaxID=35708 RepID=A0A0A9FDM6_ARUDO